MTEVISEPQPSGRKSPSSANPEPKKLDPRRVLACGTCRKRKLKCDSKRPKCSTCARLGHTCEYDEVRKKSGPKRGYVKELEARLKQVENLLTSQQNGEDSPPSAASLDQQRQQQQQQPQNTFPASNEAVNMFTGAHGMKDLGQDANMANSGMGMANNFSIGGIDDFNWDMISLGLEEPLPPQDVMDELYTMYFEKVHPSVPMIHRPRFMASLNMPMNQRPPVCLRYIMWAHACSLTARYKTSAESFYQKARKYAEQDEMKGHGESFISVPHAQAWALLTTYEFKSMYFPRAWMSCGRSTRLAQLMGLHRQDRLGLDVKQTMAPPKDWIEREERRRVFWMAYCQDRYASIGTGWPMVIDERDILTNLPASDEAFLTGKAEPTPSLADVLAGEGTSGLSSFASVCLLATLFGRNLTHLHRPADDDNDHDLNGEFWKRHRGIDNILLNTSLSLPAHLRLPYGLNDPNIVFTNMNIHTSTICLHQAAIFKADTHRLPAQISAESKRRCIVAADQITNIMKMCSHQDLSGLNPFLAFCLYVAARVFVQYLKSKKEDATVRASLTFLLSAMMALRNKNPLTESFLVQLDVDLEGSGLNIPSPLGPNRYVNRPAGECPANTDAVKCNALWELRETQTLGQEARDGGFGTEQAPLGPQVDFEGMGSAFMTHHKTQAHGYSSQQPQPPAQVNRVMSVSSSDSPGTQTWDNTAQTRSPPVADSQSNGSHSGHPTPASSSNQHSHSSHTSFSPVSQNEIHVNQYFQNDGRITNNNAKLSSHNQEQAGFGNLFGGTGFTPMPSGSGFTPGPSGSGFTPDVSGFEDVQTGMTPGPTGATPINWNDIQMPDNIEWM